MIWHLVKSTMYSFDDLIYLLSLGYLPNLT
jgi:hypothetical protein